jgi:hypothetical protein
MFNPLKNPIESLTFMYAHCGSRGDGNNHIFSVAGTVLGPNSPCRLWGRIFILDKAVKDKDLITI